MTGFIRRATGCAPAFTVLLLALFIAANRTEAEPSSTNRQIAGAAEVQATVAYTAGCEIGRYGDAPASTDAVYSSTRDLARVEASASLSSTACNPSTGAGCMADCTGVDPHAIDTGAKTKIDS